MKLFAIIIYLAFWVASARGQVKVTGDLEMYSDTHGNQYLSQFLWEDVGRVRLMQRLFPADGRKPRVEIGAGIPLKYEKFVFTPYLGWTSQDSQYILAGGVLSGEMYHHKFTHIADPKFLVTGTKPSWFYQKSYLSLNKWGLWFRWNGTISKGLMVSSQPGLEWRSPKLHGRWSVFTALQYDHAAKKPGPVLYWGLRF